MGKGNGSGGRQRCGGEREPMGKLELVFAPWCSSQC